MSLLNHLFGGKSLAEVLAMDDKKRMDLWEEHVSNSGKRKNLAKHFNFGRIQDAVDDLDETIRVLKEIEKLISPELIYLEEDEDLDEEMIFQLKRLKTRYELFDLTETVARGQRELSTIHTLMQELHKTLRFELYLIRSITTQPRYIEPSLRKLFEIIIHNEDIINKLFREYSYFDSSQYDRISLAVKSVILEQEIEEEIKSDDEKFAIEMAHKMGPRGSVREYKELGQDIFEALLEMVGAPFEDGEEVVEAVDKVEKMIHNDEILAQVIQKLGSHYDDKQIRIIIMAFRKADELDHFEHLHEGFTN